jgi:hypothetical protein
MADGTRDIKFDTEYSTTVNRLARSQKENIGDEIYKASNEDNLFSSRYDLMIFASSLAINLGKEKKLTTNKKKLATLVPANVILMHDSRIESGQSLKENKILDTMLVATIYKNGLNIIEEKDINEIIISTYENYFNAGIEIISQWMNGQAGKSQDIIESRLIDNMIIDINSENDSDKPTIPLFD